jgi:hypothetical protein
MFRLDRRALAFVCVGAVIGAAIVGAAWVIVSRQPEPAFRHTRLYDECLARGGSIMACDAAMRVVAADREKARHDYEQECLKASGMPDNPFVKIECAAPQ